MKKNERLQALTILITLLDGHGHLSQLLSEKESTPLVKEICYGVTRYYFFLNEIAKKLVNKVSKDNKVWTVLLIGLYQLHFLRIPDYAVVKETVNLLDHIKKPWAKGLLNAVLRKFCREQEHLLPTLKKNPSFAYNHPQWFIDKIKKDWPDHWKNILQANDVHPPMTLRVNTMATDRKHYLEKLHLQQIDAEPTPYSQQGILLKKPCNVESLPGFLEGEVSVQDEAAQLAASLLQLKPKLKILDACCAPGGKTCHMLELEQDIHCIALDVDQKRLQRVQENLARLHLKTELVQADALHPTDWWNGEQFDRILLDAPCSATGVIRRHPDLKLLRKFEEVKNASLMQEKLLHSIWPLLKTGGIFVYATCSIMKEENELQMVNFLEKHANAKFLQNTYDWGHSTGHGWQILPGENNMDGFFYSVMTKIDHEN